LTAAEKKQRRSAIGEVLKLDKQRRELEASAEAVKADMAGKLAVIAGDWGNGPWEDPDNAGSRLSIGNKEGKHFLKRPGAKKLEAL
jgi:hypothetical protein